MSDIEKSVGRPAEEDVKSLTIDKGPEIYDRALSLGKVLWQHVELANTDPNMWVAQDDTESRSVILDVTRPTSEKKISRYVSGVLRFWVSRDFKDLQGTTAWLPNTQDIRLYLHVHDYEIPDDMEQATSDPVNVQVIHFEEAYEYPDEPSHPSQQPHAASYENGSRLGARDTERVIGVLAFLAGREVIPE